MSQNTNLTCHNVDSYYSSPEFLANSVHIVTAISNPTHILGLYIILTKTPNSMKSVKWYFLNSHIWVIIYDNFLGVLVIPFVLIPTWSGYTLGLLRHIGVSDLTMNALILWACTNTLLSNLAIFENRFHIVCNYSWMNKWTPWRNYWLAAHFSYAALVFVPFWFLIPDQVEAVKNVFKKIPCIPDSVRSEPIFVVTEDFTYQLISLVSFLIIGTTEFVVFIICLVRNILQQLRSKKISKKTYDLQIKFFTALMVQTMVPTVLLIVPLNFTWMAILNNYYDQASTNFVLLFETLHGFCATVVMIFIHHAYRQAFLNMFFKCLMKTEEERPRSVISVGPTLIIADKV